MKSIIQKEKQCYVCGATYGLHSHHIYFGNPMRKISEKYGMKVWLCYAHHEGTSGVHGRDGHNLDVYLKQQGQKVFEEHYDIPFIDVFHKNYL